MPKLTVPKADQANLSLAEVFLGYRSVLRNIARKIVPAADVEDIVQETFIRAHQAEVDKRLEYPKSYMSTTTRNLALNHIARKEYAITDRIEDLNESDVYCNNNYQFVDYESRDKFRLFCAAVRELPLQCRRAFIMKRVLGYSIKEISAALNISDSTTEKHIAKGVLRCADYLSKTGYSVVKRSKHK